MELRPVERDLLAQGPAVTSGLAAWEWAVLSAMGVIIVALVGAIWGILRGEIRDVRDRFHALRGEMQRIELSVARHDEHKTSTEDKFDRLFEMLDAMGRKLDAVLTGRRLSPPGGTPGS